MSVRSGLSCVVAAGCLLGVPGWAPAQPASMTMADALARARVGAPSVRLAVARIDEARARLTAAGLRRANPEVDLDAGPRWRGAEQTQLDFGIGVSQAFEGGSRRSSRTAAATAGVAAAELLAELARRDAVRDAGLAFVESLYRQRVVNLLTDAERLSAESLAAAERRFAAGDVAALDVNAARIERARMASEAALAAANLQASLAILGELTGSTDAPEAVSGDFPTTTPPEDARRQGLDTRPDLAAIDAQIRQAEASLGLADGLARPEWGVGARYDRDEGDHVLVAGFTLSLPAFNKGQDVRAEALARIASLRLERDVLRGSWALRLRAAEAVLALQRQALDRLVREAEPAATDNDGLARRSYDAGQISAVEWLVLRREALQVRREILDRSRDVAAAAVQLSAIAGVLQ